MPPPGINLSIGWWDASMSYRAGNKVIWDQADAKLWGANRDNVGEEPGVVVNVASAYDFPGTGPRPRPG